MNTEISNTMLYLKLSLNPSDPSNVFDRIQNAILITSAKSEIVYVNPACTRLTGYSLEELIGQNPGMFHSGRHDKKFYEKMWTSINENGYWEGEIWNRKKSGEIIPEYLTISTLVGVDNSPGNYIAISSDISYLQKDMEKKMKLAFYDPLTELPNRSLYRDRVNQAINLGQNDVSLKHAILFMDLDKFKQVNDTYGHLVGDELLKLVGERLSSVIRTGDTIARVGGDEFTAVLNGIKDQSDVAKLATRIVDTIEKPFVIDEHKINISISVGVCLFPANGHEVDELLTKADKAMYKAKREKSKIQFYEPTI